MAIAGPARAKDRAERSHLSAVAAPAFTGVDRSGDEWWWTPVYAAFMFPVEAGGYGLRPGPAMMFSAIIARRGRIEDGRRPTRREREGKGEFRRQPLGAGDLKRLFGWSYDEIQSWGETLAADHPCPSCMMAHPLITFAGADRDGRGRGAKRVRPTQPGRAIERKNYDLVRCGDMPGRPIQAPAKRAKTGGAAIAPPAVEQLGLGITPAATAALSIGESPIVDPGSALSTISEGCDDLTLRVTAIRAIALLQRLAISDGEVLLLAEASAAAGNVDGMVIDRMIAGVAARRREAGRSLTAAEVLEEADLALSPIDVDADGEGDGTTKASGIGQSPIPEVVRDQVRAIGELPTDGGDWELRTLRDIVRRQHDRPLPSEDTLIGCLSEFRAKCSGLHPTDPVKAREALAGILTHSRVVGREPFPVPNSVLAFIRSGIAQGWIWKSASDDRKGPARTAFAKFDPGRKEQIRAVLEAAAGGGPVPWELLRERLKPHGVFSRDMVRVALDHFSISLNV